jgi:hypothetical protein
MALKLYTCIVFYLDPSIPVKKYRNVNNIEKLYKYCSANHAPVKYINVYDKFTKEYLYRFKKEYP